MYRIWHEAVNETEQADHARKGSASLSVATCPKTHTRS